jgi:hypothetical protein
MSSSMAHEDAYQAMLRERAADDAVMFAGQASANASLGFAPVGAERAGGLLGGGGGAMPMGPGEQQRYNTMLQMNGWGAPPGAEPPPPLATRGPSPGQQREAERLQQTMTVPEEEATEADAVAKTSSRGEASCAETIRVQGHDQGDMYADKMGIYE